MEKVLLNMKAISKTFGSVQALKEVSLDLYAGEVLALWEKTEQENPH